MKEKLEKLSLIEWIIIILNAIAIGLILLGFACPPPGEIHNSILVAVGELFAFASLLTILYGIKHGFNSSVKKGDFEISVGKGKKK